MPETQALPSAEELAQLPRWARLALAVRSARRVQPLIRVAWPELTADQERDLEIVLLLAEKTAERGAPPPEHVIEPAIEAVAALAQAAPPAAREACRSVVSTARMVVADQPPLDAVRAAYAARPDQSHLARIRTDYAAVQAAVAREPRDANRTVAPSSLGQLWANGVPAGWPASFHEYIDLNGFDLRAWALEQFSEEEFLAGIEDIKKNGGHSLDELIARLERDLALGEVSHQ